MTQRKHISKTLKSTATDPTVKAIMNRGSDVLPIVDKVLKMWEFDLFSRKPGAAYDDDGVFKGTDLDLAVLLYTLGNRGAVIAFPNYKSIGQRVKTDGIMKVGDKRFGNITSLVSNKDFFKFSVRIKDMSLVSTDEVGQYRTFSITKHDGGWNPGWCGIEFMPDAKENEFIIKSKIFSGNTVLFKNFVHPNRWVSFYGKSYFMTKLLIDRITQECANLNGQAKRMVTDGISLPDSEVRTYPQTSKVGDTKSVKFMAFTACIDYPETASEFPVYESTVDNLLFVINRRRFLLNQANESLKFITRITENAFMRHMDEVGLNSMPAWLKNVTWEEGYREDGKRTDWNRLILYQPAVGERGVALRFRQYLKSVKVDVDYPE